MAKQKWILIDLFVLSGLREEPLEDLYNAETLINLTE